MKYLLYMGIITLLFLTTTVAAQLGIETVGSFSSGIIVLLFLLKLLKIEFNTLYSRYTNEFNIILIAIATILLKTILNKGFEEIKQVIFFVIIPISLCILLRTQPDQIRVNIAKLVIMFFILECSLAIYERLFYINLFPLIKDPAEVVTREDWQFRSTAFLGPPLTNALVVSTIMGFIITSQIAKFRKIFLLLLGFLALLCFNARAASLIWVFLFLIYAISRLVKLKRIRISHIVLAIFALIALTQVYNLIFNFGFGGRLVNDELFDGSAMTRVKVFGALLYINPTDFWFGNATKLNYLRIMNLLGAGGIENAFIVIFINYGIIIFFTLLAAYFILIKEQLKNYSILNTFIIVISFIIVGTTNNALAGSTGWLVYMLSINSFPISNQYLQLKDKMQTSFKP